jgi:hypothetical protein
LAPRDLQEGEHLVHNRLSECRTPFGRAWAGLNIQMDNEISALRAPGWEVHPPSPGMHSGYSLEVSRLVREAFSKETPLQTEWALDRGRWDLVQSLIKVDNPLGLERILAFGVQLRLMHRWAAMDAQAGKDRMKALLEPFVDQALTT